MEYSGREPGNDGILGAHPGLANSQGFYDYSNYDGGFEESKVNPERRRYKGAFGDFRIDTDSENFSVDSQNSDLSQRYKDKIAVIRTVAVAEAKEDNFEGFEVESDNDSYVDLSESDSSLLKFEEFKWYEEKEEREKVNAPVEEDEERSDSSWDSDGSYDPKDPNPENHQFVQYKSFEILRTPNKSLQPTDPESKEGTMFGIMKKLFDRNMKNRGEIYVYALWFNLRIFSIAKEEDLRGKWETMVVPKRSYKEFEYKCFCGEKNILKRGDNSYMPVKSVIMHLLECAKFKDALKTCYLSYSLDKFVETCKAVAKHLDPEVTNGAVKQKICALVKRLLDPTVKPD
jgi:hypothetical protein